MLMIVTKFRFPLKWKVTVIWCVYFCWAQIQTEIPNDMSSVFVYMCTWVCACYIPSYTCTGLCMKQQVNTDCFYISEWTREVLCTVTCRQWLVVMKSKMQ